MLAEQIGEANPPLPHLRGINFRPTLEILFHPRATELLGVISVSDCQDGIGSNKMGRISRDICQCLSWPQLSSVTSIISIQIGHPLLESGNAVLLPLSMEPGLHLQ